MLTPVCEFVVKLPRTRVSELFESGEGKYFEMANRQMKEWFSLCGNSKLNWLELAKEAHEFTRSKA